ncbi:MAG: NADH-quinone oxidoreductase subunit NuoG [Anaerolineales bacterium]
MTKLVTLTIDGITVQVPQGTNVVDAAKKAGIDIPVFCYHPKMEPVGMCRMCLVEIGRPVVDRATGEWVREADGSPKIQFGPKLETACTTPVSEGMVVVNTSQKVKDGREDILEFLLTSHPLDCPICDKGGECPLQNLTMGFGPGQSRYIYDEKMHLAKDVPLGDLIYLDRERCIQCARCVRFQDQIVDDPVIGFYNRGRALEIVTYSEPGFDSIFSGNTTDICPVGALTTADFRFGARPWELNSAASICHQCPVGCNLTINVRREAVSKGRVAIKRIMPRQNEKVNEIWICDKGRFGYHYVESEERLTQPLLRKEGKLSPVSWEEALELVASRFRQAESELLTLASGRLSNEDLYNLRKLTEALKGRTALYTHMGGGDVVAQAGMSQGSNLGDLGEGDAILVIGTDLHQEAPLWWLRVKQATERGAQLIVANARPTRLERYAKNLIRYDYREQNALVAALIHLVAPQKDGSQLLGRWLEQKAVQEAVDILQKSRNMIVFYGSEGATISESQDLAQSCATLLQVTRHLGFPNNGLIPVWQRPNDQGAWDMGWRPWAGLSEGVRQAKAVYIVACDPAGDDPSFTVNSDFVVVQDLFLTPTAKLADVVLPALPFTEREGSLTSGERRVQRYYPAIPPRPSALADFTIAARIAAALGITLEGVSAAKVMMEIAKDNQDYASITYTELAKVEEQWPIIGRADVYYGGTSYENRQGMGVQLPNAAQRNEKLSFSIPTIQESSSEGLLAVPISRLYDRGNTLLPSVLLHAHLAKTVMWVNSLEARRLGIEKDDIVQMQCAEASAMVTVAIDETVPNGVVLVPRSVGIPINEPCLVKLQLAERV